MSIPFKEIAFALFHTANLQRLPGLNFAVKSDWLASVSRYVDENFSGLEPNLDRTSPELVNGRVCVAPELRELSRRFASDGWLAGTVSRQSDDGPFTLLKSAILFEMIAFHSQNASAALTSIVAGANLLADSSNEELTERFLPGILSGQTGCSILVCEPNAGSDLRRIQTSARLISGDRWQLSGTKSLITNGDHDMTKGHIRFVLAHTDGMPQGLKGLSLFLCADVDDEARGQVFIEAIDEKLGIRAVPSCRITFDNAEAVIIGEPGQGLRQMSGLFNLMTGIVSAQSVGMGTAACHLSRVHAAKRRQGSALAADGTVIDPAPIATHGDVRRMLLQQSALSYGIRSMLYHALVGVLVEPRDPVARTLLTLAKVLATESAFSIADLAVQVHGGNGYLECNAASRLLRDSRAARLYEGTTGVLASQFVQSVSSPKGTDLVNAFAQYVSDSANASSNARARLHGVAELWTEVCETVRSVPDATEVADGFTRIACLIGLALSWARIEGAIEHAEDPGSLKDASNYFWEQVLPEIHFRKTQLMHAAVAPATSDC